MLEDKKEVAVVTPIQTTPQTLLNIAIEKGADLEKLEKLMDLQIKWEPKVVFPCVGRLRFDILLDKTTLIQKHIGNAPEFAASISAHGQVQDKAVALYELTKTYDETGPRKLLAFTVPATSS